ncbi:MAG: Radical SAM, Pyruvate-formate lyase-activating enzyme like [Firmicutes bacterium]|nr:Radical SAM, Pyruvate-formate lyase-activating enzyme like [Bacillota bacterium]MDI6705922.1 AmmeMemoRadiSam system radical SAM enzyme [Bacillota bacterium]
MLNKEALFYTKDGETTDCFLCPHHCRIRPGNVGICGVRRNVGGTLYTENYGKLTAYNLDPVEKKPLYHFHPGKRILSVGSYGCNLKCSFCQNYAIAHGRPRFVYMLPEELADKAVSIEGNIGIAYTYNEPSIWYEYVLETARAVKEVGLSNVLVTNGFIEGQALEDLLPYIDAMNIDIKSFKESYYKDICKGKLAPVLDTAERAVPKCHVEITTLVVGGLNDDMEEIAELGSWISAISGDIPVHLSRYYPAYKMDRPPTPVEILIKAREVLQQFLNYVYIGNIPNVDNSTHCPSCGARIIERNGYISRPRLDSGTCYKCGRIINMII